MVRAGHFRLEPEIQWRISVREQSEVCPAGAETVENKAKGKLSATSKDKLAKTGLDSHSGDQELMGRVTTAAKDTFRFPQSETVCNFPLMNLMLYV